MVALRNEASIDWSQHPRFFAQGLADRVSCEFKAGSEGLIVDRFGAYFEYQESKFRTAVANPNYNFLKHQNSALDAEQLVYLVDPSNHLMTFDEDFRSVKRTAQRLQIHVLDANEVPERDRVVELLTGIAARS